MTSPLKPWEMNNRQNYGSGPFLGNRWLNGNIPVPMPQSSGLSANSYSRSASQRNTVLPPPVPPRSGDYSGQLSRFGPSNFSSFNMLSNPYHNSMYGYGFSNRFGYGQDFYTNSMDNAFVRLAEESSRPAFQSIESIVQAVASVSMMLESTYHAVYSSFRAVLGVAEHFSRLRSHLAQILSTLAVIRTFHWLYRKLLFLLGLIKDNPSAEQAWNYAANASESSLSFDEHDSKRPKSSWPILMYFAVVLGAPWLIWRLLNSLSIDKDRVSRDWASKEGEHCLATALYDFHAERSDEISLRAGQVVIIAGKNYQPKVKGWLLASTNRKKTGLIPANYIKFIVVKKGLKRQDQNKESASNTNGEAAAKIPEEIPVELSASNDDENELPVQSDNAHDLG